MLGGHDKGALFIDRAAGHWITRPFLYRKRLAREHRFVESGPAFHDRAINRHSLRSEEHTSELQSLMRISYAVFCLKKKKHKRNTKNKKKQQEQHPRKNKYVTDS